MFKFRRARTLAHELLDEPFGALDAKVRKDLRRWIRHLHDELHITSVFVTHDQEEALEVADRVVVLNAGRSSRSAPQTRSMSKPATPFVYHFLGDVNLFHGRVHAGRASISEIEVTLGDHQDAHDAPALVYVRSHDIEVDRKPNGEGGIEAIVRDVRQLGATVRLELECRDGGGLVEAQMSRDRYRDYELQSGEQVFIRPQNLRIYFKESESTN